MKRIMIDSIKISNICKIKESYHSLWILLLALAEDSIVKHCSTKISWCFEFTDKLCVYVYLKVWIHSFHRISEGIYGLKNTLKSKLSNVNSLHILFPQYLLGEK